MGAKVCPEDTVHPFLETKVAMAEESGSAKVSEWCCWRRRIHVVGLFYDTSLGHWTNIKGDSRTENHTPL